MLASIAVFKFLLYLKKIDDRERKNERYKENNLG
jgi:hypothetical protein